MGKHKYVLLFVFQILFCFSQLKTLVPKKGTIIFNCVNKIIDEKLYNKSLVEYQNKYLKSLKESLTLEQKTSGKQVDTLKINESLKFSSGLFQDVQKESIEEDNKTKFAVEFQDTIVKKFKIINDFEENLIEINLKTRLSDNGLTKNYYDYSENRVKKIDEYRKTTKIIRGHKCFKVVYTFSEPDLDEFSSLMSSYTNTREIWVTEKIKSEFHPVINEREIVTKYYALEILEYSNMLKGSSKKYQLEKLLIN